MKIAILEIGNYHDSPDIGRVFLSVAAATQNIPSEFSKKDSLLGYNYYEDEINERWLNIRESELEACKQKCFIWEEI